MGPFSSHTSAKFRIVETRIERLLSENPPWMGLFDVHREDLRTVNGLAEFCNVGCLDFEHTPAVIIYRYDHTAERYTLIRPEDPLDENASRDSNWLHCCLGVQTVYNRKTGGILTPRLLRTLLQKAVDYLDET